MNWELVARQAKNVKATKGELALLLLNTAAKLESSEDLICLLNLFFHPRCNLDAETITLAVENIKAYFTFEIHNHPSLIVPKTMPGGVHT